MSLCTIYTPKIGGFPYFSAEGDEETKIAVIQSDNEPIYLENTYLRLAQGAKELGLNDKDVSAILDFFRKLKL